MEQCVRNLRTQKKVFDIVAALSVSLCCFRHESLLIVLDVVRKPARRERSSSSSSNDEDGGMSRSKHSKKKTEGIISVIIMHD